MILDIYKPENGREIRTYIAYRMQLFHLLRLGASCVAILSMNLDQCNIHIHFVREFYLITYVFLGPDKKAHGRSLDLTL
jgi:hypothetical protein